MNQELLDAIKKRKKQLGGEEQPKEEEVKKPVQPQVRGENFNKNKKMLEDLFNKKSDPQPVHTQKEVIKGDQKNFNNAKALLEQQFGGKPAHNTNALNVQSGSGLPGLSLPPPPPSLPLGNLPLPPPPPMGMLPPPPPGGLPPPPNLNINNLLPPPPPLNLNYNPPQNKLPPPTNILPPPSRIPQNIPPPQNLPPPNRIPQNNLPPPNRPPQNNLPPPQMLIPNLPPPNLILPPPPSFNNFNPPPPQNYNQQQPHISVQRQESHHGQQPPPQQNNIPPRQENSYHQQPQYNQPKPQQPQYTQQPQQPQYNQQPQQHHYNQQPQQHQYNQQVPSNQNRPPTVVPKKIQEQEDACFILSEGQTKTKINPNIPQVSGWTKEDLSQRRKIFDKKAGKKFPLTEQFFGKNIGGLIKQQFLKSVNILGTIDRDVKKTMFNFNFPSIQNKIRNIESIQTLYANTDNLDLVSCYMTKNLNAIKIHNDERDKFINNLKNYNWESDTMKIKPIRDGAANLPNCSFLEPNFVQIKNSFKRVDGVIKTLANQQQFQKCNELKRIKVETQNMLSQYIADPQSNMGLYERIDNNILRMKAIEA